MRPSPNLRVEHLRNVARSHGAINVNAGCFEIPYKTSRPPVTTRTLRVIVSATARWDHVSVSLPDRCPTWEEMSHIKDLFFEDHETVMQLHVPKSEHINCHSYALHLWRPQTPAEWYPDVVAYAGDRESLSANLRVHLDEIYAASPPGPIPLPPALMVGYRIGKGPKNYGGSANGK
jgi:hypothetical protein